jgi:hypothetical protein
MDITFVKISYSTKFLQSGETHIVGEDGLQSISIEREPIIYRVILQYAQDSRVLLLPKKSTIIDYKFEKK